MSNSTQPVSRQPGDMNAPPLTLSRLNMTENQWRGLELSSRSTLPRFIFRGYSSTSWDGFDPRMNNANGITPPCFLQGKTPTSIYDIPDLKQMVDEHLENHTGGVIKTEFSSWSQSFIFALGLSKDHEHVAILDTSKLEPHVRVYHCPALVNAGVATEGGYAYEYLVYGPIKGPAYHSISMHAMTGYGTRYELRTIQQNMENSQQSIAQRLGEIKTLFEATNRRSSRDGSPEFTVAYITALISFILVPAGGGLIREPDVVAKEFCKCFPDEIEALKLKFENHPGSEGILLNPLTATCAQGIEVYFQILRELEKVIALQQLD
ncbi:hypothetical protein F5Y16DRAFT_420522 [Xylariaceae sp. FL0255]|nr:hypothetical protein F5Y16DRAFT_420522 [Xylariaceae sp. FL0255]